MIITKYDRNISNLFFENQPNEICSHLREKVSKGRFLLNLNKSKYRYVGKIVCPRCSKITETTEKERTKRNSEEKERRRREKSNGCARSFYNSYSGDSFWRRKLNRLLGANGPVGDNVFKWIRLDIHYYNKKSKILICNW